MNRLHLFLSFISSTCLAVFVSGCALFSGPDENRSGDGGFSVSSIRQEEIRRTGSFRCFLPPDTPDAVRILLLRTGSRMELVPAFRTGDPRTFPAMLRSGYADAAYSSMTGKEAEDLQLRSIPLPVGGLLLIRPDDSVWEENLQSSIPLD